jgi:hypothetical protein
MLSMVVLVQLSTGQHEHHAKEATTAKKSVEHGRDSLGAPMSHSYSLNLPMNRNGSGTGWLTDTSPMYGYMLHTSRWMFMFHGNVFIRYNKQDLTGRGTRGDSKIDAPNWFMAMGQTRVGGRGLFHFNVMLSLDPLFGGDGYPLLFQTGETYNGKPLVDRQHPHNLFSELSLAYTYSFSQDADAFIYVGYPGEPALGPVAFMHRPSSLNNLDSPLGHHWQDATHITFGVTTLGFRYRIFKVDASLFTGREPGEARYGFDEPRFDSYSYRVTVNPTPALSVQASRAFLKSPESVDPEEDVTRTTASVIHSLPLSGKNHFITSALVWGLNDAGDDHREHSLTFESNWQYDRLALYGRFEWVEKSAEELLLDEFHEHDIFNINALTLGVNYTFLRAAKTNFAFGVQGSFYSTDEDLNSVYGKNPLSGEVYVRISPDLMTMRR